MKNPLIIRTLITTSLAFAGLIGVSSAQDVYKSRAEMLQAEAAAKTADATIIKAAAEYGKAEAEVAKLAQEVREKQAQNDLLEAEIFYKKRAQYHEYKAAHRQPATSHSEYAQRAKQAASARLASHALGGSERNLTWPTLLRTSAYEATRREVDVLLESRTPEDSGAGSQNCVRIVALLDVLQTELRNNIRRYSASDYLAARKFISTLEQEIQIPVPTHAAALDKVAQH